MDLLERIKLANKKSEENNKKSAQAQAQHNLLTEQISEKVAEYKQEFGISFPNIEDEAKFSEFLNKQLSLVKGELTKQVELAEEVNQLILDGDIEGAQRLLGYDYSQHNEQEEEDTNTLEESDVEELDESENSLPTTVSVDEDEDDDLAEKELEEEVKKPVSRVINNDLDDLDDLEDVAPIRRPKSKKVVTSNFDMGDSEDITVSLDDITKVANVTPKRNTASGLDSLPEESVTSSEEEKPAKVRKVINIDDDDDDDDFIAPSRPIRSGGSFKFD